MDELLRAKLPGLPEKINVDKHKSVLLKDGFVIVIVTEKLTETKAAPSQPHPGHFLHDRGRVEPAKPTPKRHVVAVNEAAGEVLQFKEFGRAWNFEHEPTVEEVFALIGTWDPTAAHKAERNQVHDEYNSPKLIPKPAIVDGKMTYALYNFSNNSGSHYHVRSIQLPKNETEGLRQL